MYNSLFNSLEKCGRTEIGLLLVKKEFLIFFKIGEACPIVITFGKIPVSNKRLKICSSGWKIPLMQKLTKSYEMSPNPGLLLDFKLLKPSPNSSSWRVYSCNAVFDTFMNCLKSLEEVGMQA